VLWRALELLLLLLLSSLTVSLLSVLGETQLPRRRCLRLPVQVQSPAQLKSQAHEPVWTQALLQAQLQAPPRMQHVLLR